MDWGGCGKLVCWWVVWGWRYVFWGDRTVFFFTNARRLESFLIFRHFFSLVWIRRVNLGTRSEPRRRYDICMTFLWSLTLFHPIAFSPCELPTGLRVWWGYRWNFAQVRRPQTDFLLLISSPHYFLLGGKNTFPIQRVQRVLKGPTVFNAS